jgi:hypothetical protein
VKPVLTAMAEEEKLFSRMDQNNGNQGECRTRRSCDTYMSGSDELKHRLPTKNDQTSNEGFRHFLKGPVFFKEKNVGFQNYML